MKKTVFFGLLLLTFIPGLSLGQWYPQTCDDQGSISSIWMLNDSVGKIGGYVGTCNYNGHDHWNKVNSMVITKAVFTDTLNGWCLAEGIHRTQDGGLSWQVKYQNEYLWETYSLASVDSLKCWAVLGLEGIAHDEDVWLYGTKDGGATWDYNFFLGEYQSANVQFIDPDNGWMLSDNYVYRTADGGANWQEYANTYGSRVFHFIDTLKGWQSGVGFIANTIDGGETWNMQYSGGEFGGFKANFRDIFFLDQDYGYAIGSIPNKYDSCMFLRTNNGGASWAEQIIHYQKVGFSKQIVFTDSLRGWIVGGGYPYQVLLHTTNGGLLWLDESPQSNIHMSIYPNPVRGILNISIDNSSQEDLSYALYNLSGQIELQAFLGQKSNSEHQFSIDLSSLSKGIYLLKVQLGRSTTTEKLVVQ